MKNNTLTMIEGLRVGHAEDSEAGTGCTVVLLEPMANVAVEARGGYPTTYDTHGIDVAKRFVKRHAIFLAGGDVYGLDSAIGIRKYLLEQRRASKKAGGDMPLIVGATIYDMWRANIEKVKYADLAYSACLNASRDPVKEGSVGCGLGGTVGGFTGHNKGSKGGLGSFGMKLIGDVYVAALVVTNSMGNVYDPETGKILAGARRENGSFAKFEEVVEQYVKQPEAKENTTIGVVATNADLNHEELVKIAQMAHDGLAMAIRPTHTTSDGDTVFALSTARVQLREVHYRLLDGIGYFAAKCIASAIARSVRISNRFNAKESRI